MPIRYPWHLGSRLVAEMHAKNTPSALKDADALLGIIWEQSINHGFEEVKLRMLGILVIATRAAYDAGANPDLLLDFSIAMIRKVLHVKDRKQLADLTRRVIRQLIARVPDKDLAFGNCLDKAIRYIADHAQEKLTCDAVAAAAGCSRSHLSKLFSKQMGHSFKGTVLSLRMEKAKHLLEKRDLTVTEVAFEVGYGDPNYFGAVFKRIVGITASQYRRKVQAKAAGNG